MKLIDRVDPFFMWHVSLGEEEFFLLKREQSLLIDFSHFPYKLIELLQACVTHGREERHPVYTAWLAVSAGTEDGRRAADAVLTITEATSLRQVAHLSLKFQAVNDATMRKHLGEMLRQYRDEVDGLKSRLYTGSAFGSVPQYAAGPSMQSAGPNTDNSSSYQVLQERCRFLEDRLASLESSRFPTQAGQSQMPSQPYSTAQRRPASMSAMEAQVMGLETLVRERTSELSRMNELVSQLTQEKRQLEAARDSLQEELSGKDQTTQQSRSDVAKANEIIKKLQEEIKTTRSRLRTAEAFNRQHEKLTRDAQLTYDACREELSQLKSTFASQKADLEKSQEIIKKLEARAKELEERLDENNQVTDFLHAELYRLRQETGEHTMSPEYWSRQAAALTSLPPGEETSY